MKRFDYGKKFIIKTIIKNDRLQSYKKYIEYALAEGYEVVSMETLYENREKDIKIMALRHDVDHRTPATRRMFLLEKELDVKSTYYFRKSTMDMDLIKEMEKAGFEVGFHFETISEYMIENKMDYIEEDDLNKCRERLKRDIDVQKELYALKSICSHGAPENSKIGISNNVLTENGNYAFYGIQFEAYDKELYKNVDVHIMDENIRHGCGFAYKSNPIDAINENVKKIIFLAHPNHWHETLYDKVYNTVGMLLGRYYLDSNREFKRIAGV